MPWWEQPQRSGVTSVRSACCRLGLAALSGLRSGSGSAAKPLYFVCCRFGSGYLQVLLRNLSILCFAGLGAVTFRFSFSC